MPSWTYQKGEKKNGKGIAPSAVGSNRRHGHPEKSSFDGVHVHRSIKATRSRKTQNPSHPSPRPMAAMESAASALPTGGASRKRPRSQSPPPAGEGPTEPALARLRFGENLDLILSLQGKELSLERSARLLPLLAI